MTELENLFTDVVDTLKVKLLTVTAVDLGARTETRIWSSNPTHYPVGCTACIVWDGWSTMIYRDHRSFVANTVSDLPHVYEDHALINELGCNSCINVPVVHAGRVIATMNLLHETDWFTPTRIANIDAMVPLIAETLVKCEIRT